MNALCARLFGGVETPPFHRWAPAAGVAGVLFARTLREDRTTPEANEFPAVDGRDTRAAGTIDDERFPTDGAKGAHGAINAANENFLCTAKEVG